MLTLEPADLPVLSPTDCLQEWWGIVPEILRQAEYLSEQSGLPVFVPDLYRGKIGNATQVWSQ